MFSFLLIFEFLFVRQKHYEKLSCCMLLRRYITKSEIFFHFMWSFLRLVLLILCIDLWMYLRICMLYCISFSIRRRIWIRKGIKLSDIVFQKERKRMRFFRWECKEDNKVYSNTMLLVYHEWQFSESDFDLLYLQLTQVWLTFQTDNNLKFVSIIHYNTMADNLIKFQTPPPSV